MTSTILNKTTETTLKIRRSTLGMDFFNVFLLFSIIDNNNNDSYIKHEQKYKTTCSGVASIALMSLC